MSDPPDTTGDRRVVMAARLESAVEGWSVDDDRIWAIPRTWVNALLVVPILGAAAVAATIVHRPLFRWITHEDGPLEWAQFGFDVLAVVGAGLVVRFLARSGKRGPAVLWALFALGLVFIAGEEISWGQRAFSTETPEALERINHQEETNVHNIRAVQDTINVGFLVVGAYGSVGALALRRRTTDLRRPDWFDLFVPPFALFTLFGLVFAYKTARLVVFPSPRFVVVKYGEYVELCTAMALAAFAWLTVRRLDIGERADAADGTTTGDRPRVRERPDRP